MKDISTFRFQILFLVTVLLPGLQSVAMPRITSAAEQEIPRRHSLIHRSAVESTALPATTQGTMLQPPSAEPTRITSPIGPPKASVSLPTMPLTHPRTLAKRPAIASITAPATSSQTPRAAVTSGVAAGQVTQTTVKISKGTIPTATASVTKSTATPLPGSLRLALRRQPRDLLLSLHSPTRQAFALWPQQEAAQLPRLAVRDRR